MAERIRGQNITIVSILSALSVSVSTIVLTIIGVFGVGRGPTASGSSVPKDERSLKKWLSKLADVFRRLAGRAVETLPAIAGSVVGAILSFLAVRFVAEHKLL